MFETADALLDLSQRLRPLAAQAGRDLGSALPRLRPPGALPEKEFLERCQCSGKCVSVCPVSAIRIDNSRDPMKSGRPYIRPMEQACVLCDDLSCMKSCPSGALELVPREQISMGIAGVDALLCRRTMGDDCRLCIEKCPLGERAIILAASGQVEVKTSGCTGCGVCEMYCPTAPRAIVVLPLRS